MDINEIDFPAGQAAFQAALDAYTAAISAHASTEGVEAPTAPPLVEQAYRGGGFIWHPVPAPVTPPVVTPAESLKLALDASDTAMSRVVEDVLTVLGAKGVLTRMDLPQSAQNKLLEREKLRADLAALGV